MNNNPDKKVERIKPKSLTTSKGSIYIYLPNGKTQRFKAETGETYEQMDILVFIPPWEDIKDFASKNYPHIFKDIKNDFQYEQLIFEFAQTSGFSIRIVDEKGNMFLQNADVEKVRDAFAYFFNGKENEKSFFLPVRSNPQIGDYTFDCRYYEMDGIKIYAQHIGNKVEEIDY